MLTASYVREAHLEQFGIFRVESILGHKGVQLHLDLVTVASSTSTVKLEDLQNLLRFPKAFEMKALFRAA